MRLASKKLPVGFGQLHTWYWYVGPAGGASTSEIPKNLTARVSPVLGVLKLPGLESIIHSRVVWGNELRPSPDEFFSQYKRFLDDYLFTSIRFWESWFPLENKLRFLNFPVGAGGVLVQKSPQIFCCLIFHRAP